MNASPFMDKQILGLASAGSGAGSSSPPHSGGSGGLADLMSPNPQEEAESRHERGPHYAGANGNGREEVLPSYDFQPIRPSAAAAASAVPVGLATAASDWESLDSKAAPSNLKLFLESGPRETMEQEQKGETSSGVYTYKHHCETGLDVHDIFVKKSRLRVLLSYIGIVFLLASFYQSLMQERLCLGSVWNITVAILVAKCLQYKPVKKESVVIMPAFGVQLEIHFWSGKVDRHFVPIGKILKPLLNECVTPVTCYWSLVLLLRDEEELLLVFQKFHPPVKMLVPVWKSLCTLTSSECPSPYEVHNPGSSET